MQESTSSLNNNSDVQINHIPDEPSEGLSQTTVHKFLSSVLSTEVLDELYDSLWLFARKSGTSIDPLNRQRVKARDIIAMEDARLHLVWHGSRIYIKPMPLCLLNYDFWAIYLTPPANGNTSSQTGSSALQHSILALNRMNVLGFMRSYDMLVRHRVDFALAREAYLLPAELDWDSWSKFMVHFRDIKDDDVAKRYHYGQLRLSRLNWAVRLFRPRHAKTKWFYEIPHWSTGRYIKQAITPLLFGFASLSLVLSSMQVLLTIPDEGLDLKRLTGSSLVAMRRAFWVFSIMILLLSGAVWLLLVVIPTAALARELVWGFMNRERSDKGPAQSKKKETESNLYGP
jgi:hypothetical protein